MSKKKSISKGNAVDSLDAELVNEKPQATASTVGNKQVNLKEYAKTAPFSFNQKNYKILLIGLAINILGFILMIGGAAEDPTQFDGDALFSHTRITIAPILIVAGYVVILYGIMKKPKSVDPAN